MARLVDAIVFAIGFLSAMVAASSSFVTFVDTEHMLLCSLGSLIVGMICFGILCYHHPQSWRFYFITIGGPSLLGGSNAVFAIW